MPRKKKEPVAITHKIKGCLDASGGVSNYEDKTQSIIDHFKEKTIETLAKHGIELEWIESDDNCDLQMKFVEMDTGNKTVRFFVGWLPILSSFCGPAARFEAEGHYLGN